MEEMHFRHQGDGGDIPRGLGFLLASDLFGAMAPFAGGFVDFNTSIVRSVVGDIHGSPTTGIRAAEMFMLKGLNEPSMTFSFLR